MKKSLMIVIAGVLFVGLALAGTVYAKSAPPAPMAPMDETEVPEEEVIDPELVCSGEIQHPDLVALAEQYLVDYELLQTYFCEGFEVVDIQLALETAAHDGVEYTFEEILAMRFVEGEEAMTWEEIWALLEITDMEVPVDEEEEEDSVVCDTEAIHPVLTRMAAEYSVDYQVLEDYFCQGFGVGEIKHALETAALENVPLTYEELLAMRFTTEGEDEMGWGEIWQQLGLIGKNKQNTEQTQTEETVQNNNGKKPAVPPGQAKEKTNNGKGH